MRFGLKTLLALVSIAAVLCALWGTAPPRFGVSALWMLTLLLPPALVAGSCYLRGAARAFSIGALTTAAPFVFAITQTHGVSGGLFEAIAQGELHEEAVGWLKSLFAILWASTAFSGLVCVGVRQIGMRLPSASGEASTERAAAHSLAGEPHLPFKQTGNSSAATPGGRQAV